MATSVHLWAPGFGGFGGGIGAFSRELALALSRGHSVCLAGKSDVHATWNGLPLWGAGRVPSWARTTRFSAGVVALALAQRPHLIVSTHVNFGPLAWALSRVLKIPYVLVAHGIDVSPSMTRPRLRALRAAARVWPVSRWTRDRLLGSGVSPDRISIVPNTVSDADFDIGPPSEQLKSRYLLASDEKVILTVARLDSREAYKGHDHIIRALPTVCRAIGPVRYLVVGTGGDRPRLEGLISEAGVKRHVTFCGFIPDAALADHYRLGDVFAMPSIGEGFGVAYLEAMACGVPVLGGNEDGTSDPLADGELGLLVNPHSPDAIAQGLIDLLRRQGPDIWFSPASLRARCLERFGRSAFQVRVREAIRYVGGGPEARVS